MIRVCSVTATSRPIATDDTFFDSVVSGAMLYGHQSAGPLQLGYVDGSCGPNQHRTFGGDTILEIVTHDTTTIRNTITMADTFRSIGYKPTKVQYIVNRADSTGGVGDAELARAIGRVPEHRVVSDGKLVVQANNDGVPFVLAAPAAQVSRDVVAIATACVRSDSAAVPAGR